MYERVFSFFIYVNMQDSRKDKIYMRIISADAGKVKGPHNKMFKKCVGCGRAYEGLIAENQRHMGIVKNECGFKYLRFHGLLHDDMAVYSHDKDGNPVYNWQYVDLLYDYMLSIGIRPFVEIGFMPDLLASGRKTIFWWKGNITPPSSYEKWEDLIYELVLHFTQRYGLEEVKNWYFEVWNEPNLDGFWSGGREEYFRLYEVTAKAIKKVCADYRVGGPATAGIGWITDFIDFCHDKSVPVDFISTHSYGISVQLDEYGVEQLYLDKSPGAVVDDVRKVYEWVKSSRLPNLEIHFTEWSASCSPRDNVHDAYHSAPYILSKLKRCEGYADSMSYWVYSDIFEETGPPKSHFHGGFGLLNVQGLKKPAFFAYKFLNRLGDVELECNDEDAWVCKQGKSIQALFWNYTYAVEQDAPNQVFYTRDLPSSPAGKVQLRLTGLEPGCYQLSVYCIGYRQNDVYSEFLDMNCRGTLTREQVEMLNKKAAGLPVVQTEVVADSDGSLTYELDTRENEVILITID